MARQYAAVAALGLSVLFSDMQTASARPVSYQGGWTVIEETNRNATALWVHYTINPKLSLGWRSEWNRNQDFVYNGPQATWLAKRWLGTDYQANIYAIGSLGVTNGVGDNPDDAQAAGFVGTIIDWETRRLFASYTNRGFKNGPDDIRFMQAARVGFAPYQGDTGDLHTWLMVEVDHRPDNREPVSVTPLVRFFKGGTLLEVGWNLTANQPLVNFIHRF